MNPELPAEEEMKKPSTPPWPHSLVSCELCPVTDRKSAKKCSLLPLHGAIRPGCRGPLWMGNVDAGAWSQEPTGLRAFLALAESSSGTQDRREPAGDQALLDSQWVTLRGNKGLLGGVCRRLHGRQRGAEGRAPKLIKSVLATQSPCDSLLLLLGLQGPERQMDLVKIHGR